MRGIADVIIHDRTVLIVALVVVALVLVLIIASVVSSCSRASVGEPAASGTVGVSQVSSDNGEASTTTNIVDGTKLNPTVDLASLAPNTVVSVAVSAETEVSPWLEVSVDGVAVYADRAAAGSYNEWTVGSEISVRLNSIEGVTVSVGSNTVTPVLEGGVYVLTASVPEDKRIVEPTDQQAADQQVADGDETDESETDQSY